MKKILNQCKKILKKELSIKLIAILFTVIFILSLLPIFQIAFYSHPMADDFTYGNNAHQVYMDSGSALKAIGEAVKTVDNTYKTWQGTFSSAFFMALNPATFCENIYWITPFIMIGILILGILLVTQVLLTEVFFCDKWASYVFGLIVLTASIQNFYWPAQGIYWYNGAIHYTFMYGCMLLMLALQLHSLFIKKTWKFVIAIIGSSFLAVICGGGSFPIALICVLLNITILLYSIVKRKERIYWVTIPVFINVIAFIINIGAPGNEIRKAYFAQMTPIQAIKNAMEYMFVAEYKWFTIVILLLIVLVIPISWQLVAESRYDYRFPGIVSILSYLACAAMCTPSFYATSEVPLARVINVIRLMYHLLLFLNVFYWVGWLRKKKCINLKPIISIALLIGVFLLGIIDYRTTEIPQREFITYGAYCSYITGEANIYRQEYLDRKELLNSSEENIILKAYSVRPFPFWTYDITDHEGDWLNQAVAIWYHKQSVVIK